MENQLQIFSNPDFGDIRAIEIDGKPLFVGRDIATALGYTNPTKALQDHVPDKFKCIINAKTFQQMASQKESNESEPSFNGAIFDENAMGGVQRLTFITEAGLYKLIFRSKLPNAEKFSDWVCEEVLPAIRKHGYYSVETIQDATDNGITDFERGKTLIKLSYSACGNMRQVIIAKAANLIAGENLFDLDDIGGTKALADNTDTDNFTFEPAFIDVGNDIPPARYALTLGKWKRKKK